MKRKINPSDGEGEGETTEENNNSRPDASGSEQVKIQSGSEQVKIQIQRQRQRQRQRQKQKQKQKQRCKWIQKDAKSFSFLSWLLLRSRAFTLGDFYSGAEIYFRRLLLRSSWFTFTQEQSFYFLKKTFTQEQSQEEDAKDCTGQISKPVSQDLCRISN